MSVQEDFPNIDKDKNYENTLDGRVFTGDQLLNLLEVARGASPTAMVAILLSATPTDKPASKPKSKYGV